MPKMNRCYNVVNEKAYQKKRSKCDYNKRDCRGRERTRIKKKRLREKEMEREGTVHGQM